MLEGFVGEVLAELAGLFTASKLGWFGKVAGKVVSSQAVQKVATDRVGKAFGLVDEAGKTLEEELLTVDLINYLKAVGPEVDTFISLLRKEERGEEKVIAFRVFLASGIKKGSRERKEFIPNPGGKPTEEKRTILDLEWGKSFIERLLSRTAFEDRVKYLDDQGVFSTMKKPAKPHPHVEKAKKFVKEKTKENHSKLSSTMSEWRRRSEAWRNSRIQE